MTSVNTNRFERNEHTIRTPNTISAVIMETTQTTWGGFCCLDVQSAIANWHGITMTQMATKLQFSVRYTAAETKAAQKYLNMTYSIV